MCGVLFYIYKLVRASLFVALNKESKKIPLSNHYTCIYENVSLDKMSKLYLLQVLVSTLSFSSVFQ